MLSEHNIPKFTPDYFDDSVTAVKRGGKHYTPQEEIIATVQAMKDTIDRVMKMENKINVTMNDFISHISKDNVLFKDLVRNTYTTFSQEVKNEVNSFESDIDNAISLFTQTIQADYAGLNDECKALIAENEKKYNSDVEKLTALFDSFKEALTSTVENNNTTHEQALEDFQTKLTTELNTFIADVNAKHTRFTESMTETWETFKTTWESIITNRLDGQDAKIDDNELYMKTNLTATITSLIGDMKDNGELEAIINGEVFNGLEERIEKSKTYANIKHYGAIGDWESHPLSESYSTLDEALIEFPNATALTDEKDTLALMLAIASTADVVLIPYGGYKIDREIMLNEYTIIEGISQDKTQLHYNSLTGNCFNAEGKNKVQIRNLYIGNSANTFVSNTVSCIDGNEAIAINAKNSCYSLFENIRIYGFNCGIEFADNSYVSAVRDCKIQNCDNGIHGNSEFNSIVIDRCEIHHCNIGVYAGAGRTKNLNSCTFEHNNTGVHITNKGTAELTNCYFEGNYEKDIKIQWGLSSTNHVTIDRCSFYNFRADRFIEYHMDGESVLVVSNCYFEKSEGNENESCFVFVPTNNTHLIPISRNNKIVNCVEVNTPTNIIKDVVKRSGFCFVGATDNEIIVDSKIEEGYENFRFVCADGVTFQIPFLATNEKTGFIRVVGTSSDTETTFTLSKAENVGLINYIGSLKANKVYTLILNRIYAGDDDTILNEWILSE